MTTTEELMEKIKSIESRLSQPNLPNAEIDQLTRKNISLKLALAKTRKDDQLDRVQARRDRDEKHNAEVQKVMDVMAELDNQACQFAPGSTQRNQLEARVTQLRIRLDRLQNWGGPQ